MELKDIFTYENLYRSWKSVSRGARHKHEFLVYKADLTNNLKKIEFSFKIGKPIKLEYYSFVIREPKYRIVWATTIEGRIIQDCLCKNYLRQKLEPLLIDNNVACRLNKGTDMAIDLLQDAIEDTSKVYKDDFWYVKADVSKYFDNIDHELLKQKLSFIEDDEIRDYLYMIIDGFPNGLPLGNQTSQWFALLYLNEMDIEVSNQCLFYVRYMDDFIAIVKTKEEAISLLSTERIIAEKNKIKLNKKTEACPIKNGIPFLGWKFILSNNKAILKQKPQNKKRTKYKFKEAIFLYKSRQIDSVLYSQKMNSFLAYLSKGDTKQIRKHLCLFQSKISPNE